MVILSHYHALSSFVFGVGIGDGEDEPPCLAGRRSSSPSPPVSPGSANGGARTDEPVGLDGLVRRMQSLAEQRQEFTAEEQTKRYQSVESQSAELGVTSAGPEGSRPKPEISQFIDDPDFVYQVRLVFIIKDLPISESNPRGFR